MGCARRHLTRQHMGRVPLTGIPEREGLELHTSICFEMMLGSSGERESGALMASPFVVREVIGKVRVAACGVLQTWSEVSKRGECSARSPIFLAHCGGLGHRMCVWGMH